MKSISILLVMLLCSFQIQALAEDFSPTRVRCQSWHYGFSGTFQCPKDYSGVTRPCWHEAYNLEKKEWIEIGYRVQEGCGKGTTGSQGYCVMGCF